VPNVKFDKNRTFTFIYFYQMSDSVTFGTNNDKDILAISLPNGFILGPACRSDSAGRDLGVILG